MPFIFIVPVWLLIVLVALPLFRIRRLRFLAVHIVMASTIAILISSALSISVLVAGTRLPTSRVNGILIFGLSSCRSWEAACSDWSWGSSWPTASTRASRGGLSRIPDERGRVIRF